MSVLLDKSSESFAQIEGGIICPVRQHVFVYNPIQQIPYNARNTKNFNEIGQQIMALSHSCNEQHVIFSCTWHKVVDIETGRIVREIYEQDGFVKALSCSPTNPNVFAATGTDSTIRTFDIRAHPAQTLQLRRQRRYNCVSYSPDSNLLAFGGDSINLVDLSNPRNISQINCPSPVLTIRFNPLEYLLSTTSEDRVVRFWDIESEEIVSQSLPFPGTVKNIEFDGQGKCLLASCGSVLNALHWEPLNVIGQVDLAKGASSFMKPLDLRTHEANVLQLGVEDQRLILYSTPLSEVCFPTQPQFFANPLGLSLDLTSEDSAIGTIRSVEAAARQQSSESTSPSPSKMTGACCLIATPSSPQKFPNFSRPSLASSPPAADTKTAKPTRTRSNVRLNLIKEPARNTNLRCRTPSAEGINTRASDEPHANHKSSRASSISGQPRPNRGSQPVTPVDEKPPGSLKRNGSLPGENYVVEKHSSVMEMLNQRIRDCRRINMMLRVKNGEDEALDEAAKLQGFHIFAQILRSYKHQPAAYSLQFCARVLPTLRPMLSHKNVEYVDLALDTLANLLNEFSEPIKHVLAANAMGTIGVDVAAEARYAFCTTSKQAFTDLYLNSSFIISRLSPDQRDYFNMLLPIIERIVEL